MLQEVREKNAYSDGKVKDKRRLRKGQGRLKENTKYEPDFKKTENGY